MYELIDQNGKRHMGLYANEWQANQAAQTQKNPRVHLTARKVEGEPTPTTDRNHRANAKPGRK